MDPPSSLFLFFLCSNHYQTNKKSIGENAQNTNTAEKKKKCRQSLLSTFLPSIWPPEKTTFWRQNLRGPRQLMMVCIRDECRRRMVQGEFEVGGGTGGATGLPGPGITGHGGITGPSSKLPSPDSPVSDVNSILAGAHLQVRVAF